MALQQSSFRKLTNPESKERFRHAPWLGDLLLVLAVSTPFTFWGTGMTFLDPDEGVYGTIVRGMLESNDWIVTRFNDLIYIEKPPLFYWLSALTMSAVDDAAEWPIRIWSIVPGLATVLLVWHAGRLIYGRRAGLFAALAFTSSVGYVLYVWKASTDFLLVFSVTLALVGFLRDAGRSVTVWHRFSLLYLGIALGLLTKGLIGAVFPVLIVLVVCLWTRRVQLRELNLARGVPLVALIVLPWYFLVLWRDPDLMWYHIVDNQLMRFLEMREIVEEQVHVSTLGFWLATLIWFFPWTLFLLARRTAGPMAPLQQWEVLLPIWALVVMVFFSLSRSKLEFYGLPALVPFALMVGGAWQGGRDIALWLWAGALASVVAGWKLIEVGTGITPNAAMYLLAHLNVYYRTLADQGVAFPFDSPKPLGDILRYMGGSLIAGWTGAAMLWALGRRQASFGAMLVMCAVMAVLIMQIVAFVEPHHSVEGVASALNERTELGDVIVHEGSLEYSAGLPFYTGRRIVMLADSENRPGRRLDLMKHGAREPEDRAWFIERPEFEALWAGPRRVFFVTRWPVAASAVSRLPRASVHEIGQFGSRRLYSNR